MTSLALRLASLCLLALPVTGCGSLACADFEVGPCASETVVVEEPCAPPPAVVVVEEEHCRPRREVVVVERERRCEAPRPVVYAPRPAPCAPVQHNAITWNPSPARAPSNSNNHNVTDNRDHRR
jgi:hypothetical protein